MELLYALYKPAGKQSRYVLLFPLGNRNGKLCAIETGKVSVGDVNRITANKDKLSTLSLEKKIAWIKNHCPNAYKNGLREIWDKNIQEVSKHPM